MTKPANPFAFPRTHAPDSLSGMTLRDWFAGQALAGYIASPDSGTVRPELVARDCYGLADAMLAERAKEKQS